VSLLLDALKRAEQEKQLSRGMAEREPVIAPMAANAPAALPLELQPLKAAGAAASPSLTRNEAAAHAAQAVFQAKKPVAAEGSRNRGMIFAIIAVIVIAVAGAGAYVWTQVRQLSAPAAPLGYSAKRPPPAPTAEPASVASHREVPIANAGAPRPFVIDPTPPVATTAPDAATPASREEALVAQALQDRPGTAREAAPAVQLARTADVPRIAPEVSRGYQALKAGDLATARQAYQSALASDPRNVDALLGAATVEARGGNRPAAAGHYRQVLQIDPRNATALAALASLADAQPTDRVESQIRQDLARAPGNAALHFALGNLYASQGRWNEAQAAYFESHRLDPASPDTCFNLAVALDHLGKGRLAATFYRRGLEAARGQAAQFDAGAASRRATELEASADAAEGAR